MCHRHQYDADFRGKASCACNLLRLVYETIRHRSVRASIAKQMASIAGLRNRLAHDYEDIDNRIVYNNIARILKIFPVYLAAVRERIEAD